MPAVENRDTNQCCDAYAMELYHFIFTIKLANLRNKLSNYVQGFLEVPVTECITSTTYWNIRNSLINTWTHKLHHTYSLQ